MSGHSKWHNIAKRKGANDAKKAKIFTKIGREMAIAIKEGGSANPEFNARPARLHRQGQGQQHAQR